MDQVIDLISNLIRYNRSYKLFKKARDYWTSVHMAILIGSVLT